MMINPGDLVSVSITGFTCFIGVGGLLAARAALGARHAARAQGCGRCDTPELARPAGRQVLAAAVTPVPGALSSIARIACTTTGSTADNRSSITSLGEALLTETSHGLTTTAPMDDRVLARLAGELDGHRRRGLARTRLAEELAALDDRHWHIERDVTCRGVTMPFVAFGPTGVFAFSSSDEWAFSDLAYLDRVSKDLGAMIAGYPDPVRTGLYLPLDDQPPRVWFDSLGQGGWIVGRGCLARFFAYFNDRGLSAGELATLRMHLAASTRSRPRMRTRLLHSRG